MASDQNKNATTYTGTLIFCIIATCVTIVIIVLFFFVNVDKVKYMLLTIEVCLVLIIVNAVISIIMMEKAKAKKDKEKAKNPMSDLPCPDYFTRSIDPNSGETTCTNIYSTKNGTVIIGKPIGLSIQMTSLGKQPASEVCKRYANEWEGNIPYTSLKSICDTVT
jgi:hypothetical protein